MSSLTNPGQFNTPKQENLIYDVGLHVGEDTDFYLRKGFRVVAFEANPDLIKACEERFKNEIKTSQLRIIGGAIVDPAEVPNGSTMIPFYVSDSGTGLGTTQNGWARRNEMLGSSVHVIEVNAVSFANSLSKYGVPHYLKIDIEGCDLVCLKALKYFRERPNYLSIESDKTSLSKIRAEIDLMVELGYDGFQAVEQYDLPLMQSPPFPAREGNHVSRVFERGSSGLFGREMPEEWRSRQQILTQYRFIRMGYYLLGDEGKMYKWRFPGVGPLKRLVSKFLKAVSPGQVPGWYDTHARLASRRGGPHPSDSSAAKSR